MPDGATEVLTGTYHAEGEVSRRLLDALPPHLVLSRGEWQTPVLGLLAAETLRDEVGQDAVLDRLLDLLLIDAVRTWFARTEQTVIGGSAIPGSPLTPAGNVKHGSRSPGRVPAAPSRGAALRRGTVRLMMPLGGQGESETGRLEAFSDGVLAVIITIMALELKAPVEGTFASLRERLPALLIYILSFTFIGIYWNNHHHLLRAARRVTAGVMWANLHLLFWLSLLPVLTEWVGEHYTDHAPAATYGFVGLCAAVAFTILTRAIIRADGSSSLVAEAIGRDVKGRASLAIYAAATALAFVSPWISYGLFVTVAVIWFVPDRRLSDR